MEQKLRNLYNALLNIETKGSSTIQMAECLRYTEQLMAEEAAKEAQAAEARRIKKVESVPAVENYPE